MNKMPIQPLYTDEHGTLRFVPNKIVEVLLETSPLDLNAIAVMDFTNDEREQFAQLIGYSLSGFGSLSYVSDDTYDTVQRMKSHSEDEEQAKINVLTNKLESVREHMRNLIPEIFNIHPDDLSDTPNM